MREGEIHKIERVSQFWVPHETSKGKRKTGPYWRGAYRKNGREVTVYIGKELPGELLDLLLLGKRRSI